MRLTLTDEQRAAWLQRAVVVFLGLLMASTWPLWWTPLEDPQIPWLRVLCDVPRWVDTVLLGVLAAAGIGLLIAPRDLSRHTFLWGLFLFGFGGLVSFDQHRLQPWAWQFLLMGVIFAFANATAILKCCRWLTISIYFHSAHSKLDYTFMVDQGAMLRDEFLEGIGWNAGLMNQDQAFWMPLAFPAGELLIALLLAVPRWRRLGLPLSLAMHVALIWLLGYRLQHEWGVLLWNGFFIVQNVLLFGDAWLSRADVVVFDTENPLPGALPASEREKSVPDTSSVRDTGARGGRARRGNRFAAAFTAAAMLFPFLELIGWCDHWPAWAVYSARTEEVAAGFSYIGTDPPDVKGLDHWHESISLFPGNVYYYGDLDLDAWSYSHRHCPVYPQARYRIARFLAFQRRHPTLTVSIFITTIPDRVFGEQETMEVNGKLLRSFLWNIEPRQ